MPCGRWHGAIRGGIMFNRPIHRPQLPKQYKVPPYKYERRKPKPVWSWRQYNEDKKQDLIDELKAHEMWLEQMRVTRFDIFLYTFASLVIFAWVLRMGGVW
jgi:hypothetical protein